MREGQVQVKVRSGLEVVLRQRRKPPSAPHRLDGQARPWGTKPLGGNGVCGWHSALICSRCIWRRAFLSDDRGLPPSRREVSMTKERITPLRKRMIDDMRIRGMGERAQPAHTRSPVSSAPHRRGRPGAATLPPSKQRPLPPPNGHSAPARQRGDASPDRPFASAGELIARVNERNEGVPSFTSSQWMSRESWADPCTFVVPDRLVRSCTAFCTYHSLVPSLQFLPRDLLLVRGF